MDSTIIVAAFGFAGTLAGSFGGIMAANKLVNYRLGQLEKKVDEHNNLVSRMYAAEQKEALLSEAVEHLKKFHE